MKKPTVFISYNDDAHYYLITLKNTFNKGSHESRAVIIDWRESESTNLKKFMESAGERDFVVLLISDGYLQSENCMYEIYQLLFNPDGSERTDFDWTKKIVPIVLFKSEDISEVLFKGIDDSGLNYDENKYYHYWHHEAKLTGYKEQATKAIGPFLNKLKNMHFATLENGIGEIVKRVYKHCLAQQVDIYLDRSTVPYTQSFEESKTIRAMGVACRHLCTNANELKRYLAEEKEIKLILLDPTCYGAVQRAIDEHGDHGNPITTYHNICSSFEVMYEAINSFIEEYPTKAVNLELRLQTSQPTTTCTITDNDLFFNHYGKKALGLGLPCYRFSKRDAAVAYEVYENQFQSYWESADPDNCFDLSKEDDRIRWKKRLEKIEAASDDFNEKVKVVKATSGLDIAHSMSMKSFRH